jgi:hypothetical protein
MGPGSIISSEYAIEKKSKSRDIINFIMGEYLSKPDKTKHTESGESP